MLSYITLSPDDGQQNSYVSLCGTSSYAMLWMLEQSPSLRTVYLCLDNDAAGIKAVDRLGKLLEDNGYIYEPLLPKTKDWNDELLRQQRIGFIYKSAETIVTKNGGSGMYM